MGFFSSDSKQDPDNCDHDYQIVSGREPKNSDNVAPDCIYIYKKKCTKCGDVIETEETA